MAGRRAGSNGQVKFALDVSMFQAFSSQSEHHSGEPVWEMMKMIGADLVNYVTGLRSRMNQVAEVEEIWELGEVQNFLK